MSSSSSFKYTVDARANDMFKFETMTADDVLSGEAGAVIIPVSSTLKGEEGVRRGLLFVVTNLPSFSLPPLPPHGLLLLPPCSRHAAKWSNHIDPCSLSPPLSRCLYVHVPTDLTNR